MRRLLEQLSEDGLKRAFTHPSYAPTRGHSYQRLEFLGDAVLGCVITNALCDEFPDFQEGKLSKLKSSIVSRTSCAEVAREHQLGKLMVEYAPEAADRVSVERNSTRESVLAALTESVIGAAFSELGYSAIEQVIVDVFSDRIRHAVDNLTDYKSQLQEIAQRQGHTVDYQVVSVDGPDHERVFTVEAQIEDGGYVATGSGRSKKVAEQEAAGRLVQLMDEGSS